MKKSSFGIQHLEDALFESGNGGFSPQSDIGSQQRKGRLACHTQYSSVPSVGQRIPNVGKQAHVMTHTAFPDEGHPESLLEEDAPITSVGVSFERNPASRIDLLPTMHLRPE